MKFALSNEPLDYQVSVHINNMFNTFQRFEIMSTYDYLKTSQFELIYEEMRPDGTSDKIAYALYNIIQYYGWERMDTCLTELFNENVKPIKVAKPRKLKRSK